MIKYGIAKHAYIEVKRKQNDKISYNLIKERHPKEES
jgi:hypothetical protein